MNRQQRKQFFREYRDHRQTFTDTLTPVPEYEWPKVKEAPVKVWRSKKYLVQMYRESTELDREIHRLSIQRTEMMHDGTWKDGLTWDELQAVKRDIGFGEYYAVEVYPRDCDLVNVANIRHLWLFSTPLPIGWFGGAK